MRNIDNSPMAVSPIPDGYRSVTPWIITSDTSAFIDFITRAFGAVELARIENPDGSIGHAEARIGDSIVMMFDSKPDWPATPSFIRLFVPDCDAVFEQSISAGATVVTDVTALYFGDRVARVRDPFGNLWWIQTHVEDVAFEDMMRRAQQPAEAASMTYVQQSLDQAMIGRA